jgi:hypothetical protein
MATASPSRAPLDASTKFLVEMYPEDWIALLGLPKGHTHIEEDMIHAFRND